MIAPKEIADPWQLSPCRYRSPPPYRDSASYGGGLMERCPVAASSSVAPLVTGPPRRVAAVATTPTAAYFTTGDPARPLLCVVTADAVRLPCALVLGPGRPLPTAAASGIVGEGALRAGGLSVRVGRWWRPPRPRGLGRMPAVTGVLTRRVPDPLDSAGRAALTHLVRALAAGEPHAARRRRARRGAGDPRWHGLPGRRPARRRGRCGRTRAYDSGVGGAVDARGARGVRTAARGPPPCGTRRGSARCGGRVTPAGRPHLGSRPGARRPRRCGGGMRRGAERSANLPPVFRARAAA